MLTRIGLASLTLALLLAVSAVLAHRAKTARSNRAELAEWYCTNRGTACGGASSAGIERQWNGRETRYEVAFAVLGAVGVASLAGSRRRGLRPGSSG